jgi:hypothetical protein
VLDICSLEAKPGTAVARLETKMLIALLAIFNNNVNPYEWNFSGNIGLGGLDLIL